MAKHAPKKVVLMRKRIDLQNETRSLEIQENEEVQALVEKVKAANGRAQSLIEGDIEKCKRQIEKQSERLADLKEELETEVSNPFHSELESFIRENFAEPVQYPAEVLEYYEQNGSRKA